ncbi:Six-bladed beta-propeller, TolB-like protein [Niveomyces insectorum RCEF 264]|uniref:Six-bladed beta-propeller, TolB-like protein n=1 Tax=Niveomyces insectorum RCEF 264 TaxID=1081102 RepID=A0A162KAE0_9HYPO|nr:Six-bladed beta-propeller, TolB-like protein [Niveomyces insectorum RCEF 264]
MRSLSFLAAWSALLTASRALPVKDVLVGRQAAASSIYKLPGSAWIENLVVRPSGELLLARLDTPELWTYDPATKTGAKVPVTFTDALSLTGITEVAPDVYAVVAGNFSTRGFTSAAGSWAVWSVDLSNAAPQATLVKRVPESAFFIGVAPLGNDSILVADAGKATLYRMDLATGAYSVALADATMKAPAQGSLVEGVHGLKYQNGIAYFTNTFGGGFYKVAVDAATGRATGTPTEIANLKMAEDFVVAPDGSGFYVAQPNANAVTKVTPSGKTSKAASASSCSSVAFGRGTSDKNTLYISTTNGAVFSVTIG